MPEVIDVAIPVRNEEQLIGNTLTEIHNQRLNGDYRFNVTVVANNCSDRTTEVARKTIASFESRPEVGYSVIEQDHAGKNAAINTILGQSATKKFMYVDGYSATLF